MYFLYEIILEARHTLILCLSNFLNNCERRIIDISVMSLSFLFYDNYKINVYLARENLFTLLIYYTYVLIIITFLSIIYYFF